ncbi:MAG: OmpA family protein [Desulfobacterales bacterium]|nr:OmpA family protein [Desulfobacterales bacterium]
MKRIALVVFTASLFLSSVCFGDTVFLKSRDRIHGTIENEIILLNTDYGKLRIQRDFIKSMLFQEESGKFLLQSINNDVFTGLFFNDGIDFTAHDNQRFHLGRDQVSGIAFGSSEKTYEIDTVLFVMGNGDKFSGRFLADEIEVQNEYGIVAIASQDLSRIDFAGKGHVTVGMNNGSSIQGQLMTQRLIVAMDAAETMSICTGQFKTVLFHVKKLVAKAFENRSDTLFDSDSDSVPDGWDRCPDSPCGQHVNETGCPPVNDADGDGVSDDIDQCPTTPRGVDADAHGCWVIGLPLFDTNSARINRQHYPLLDDVVAVLEENASLRIEIQGHSDNVGSAAVNARLTQNRALAVMDYLVSKGVSRNRLDANGFGSTRPVASNDTAEGRAENRRVELRPLP